MSQSEGPSSRPKSPRSTSGLGRGRGKTGEGRPGVRPAPQRSPGRSDPRSESTRGVASGSPAPSASSQQQPPPPAENASPSQLSLLEVQLSLLTTKVTALEEAKDKVEFLQSTLQEVEKRANFLQKANEVFLCIITIVQNSAPSISSLQKTVKVTPLRNTRQLYL